MLPELSRILNYEKSVSWFSRRDMEVRSPETHSLLFLGSSHKAVAK